MKRVVLLAHFEANKLIEFARNCDLENLAIEVLSESPLGTAGSIINAVQSLDDLEEEINDFKWRHFGVSRL